jgi:radical SAM superfamily enzyme YgiQ (UPF0313 family)
LPERSLCVIAAAPAEFSPKALSLGAACVVAAVKADPALSSRVEARLENAAWGESAADYSKRIAAMNPRFLGFSLYVWNRSFFLDAASRLRSLLPGTVFFAGGPEASSQPDSFQPARPFDHILTGEGESTVPALLAELLAGGNPSFSLSRGAMDAEKLPSPWLDGSIPALRRGGALWELARGCPFACSYCYESKGERKLRHIPRQRLERELEHFVDSGIEQVSVLDPTFNADRKRTKEILEMIGERGGDIHFSFEVRAEFLDREQARLFSEIPCSVQIGLQSSNPEVMKALNRPFDPEAFARKARMLDEAGAVYGFDLIYGLPGDSLEGFLASLGFSLAQRPNHLDIFRLAVLPGTALADEAEARGIDWDRAAPYLVRSLPGFPAQDLERAASFARAVEVFYNRGRAVPWFQALATAAGMAPGALMREIETALRLRSDCAGLGEVDSEGGYDHARIEGFQVDFARSFLVHRKRPECIEAMLDLIRLHGAYSRALAEGQESVVDLSYDPDAILGPGGMDPRAFARAAKKKARRVWIGRDEDGEIDLRPLP